MKLSLFAAAAIMAIVPIASHAQSSVYSDGLADRSTYETWTASLSPLERIGANYWASQRSLRNPGPCTRTGQEEIDRRIEMSCREAQRRLAPTDARRLSETEYRRGWNAFQETPSVATSVAPPTIAAPPVLEPNTPTLTCKENVAECKDIRDALNNFSGVNKARIQCKYAADKEARFGDPEWGWFSYFHSFVLGPEAEKEFKKTSNVILAETDTLVPNKFGGKSKMAIRCFVTLSSGDVSLVYYE